MTGYVPPVWAAKDRLDHVKLNAMSQGIADMTLNGGDPAISTVLQDPASESYAAVESTVDAHLGGDATGLVTTVAGKVAKGSIVINAREYPTLPDAITAAIQTGSSATVYLPPGQYGVGSQVSVPAGVTLRGDGPASIIRANAATAYLLQMSGGSLNSLAVDGAGLVTAAIVRIRADDTRVTHCTITDTGHTALYGLDADGTYARPVIENNLFSGVAQPVRLRGKITGGSVADNRITDWTQRGIYLQGSPAGLSDGLRITGNRISGLSAGGTVRYPIRADAGGQPTRHANLVVSDNHVTGPGRSYTATNNPGTADQISVSGCDGLTAIGNVSIDGGDAGMTIELCSKVVAVGNRIERADSAGMYVGAQSTGPTTEASVTGNIYVNCGQNRSGDRTDSRAGIRATADDATIAGNTFVDDQTTPTMLYGVSMTNCSNVELGSNANHGVATLYYNESGNTGISVVQTAAL